MCSCDAAVAPPVLASAPGDSSPCWPAFLNHFLLFCPHVMCDLRLIVIVRSVIKICWVLHGAACAPFHVMFV